MEETIPTHCRLSVKIHTHILKNLSYLRSLLTGVGKSSCRQHISGLLEKSHLRSLKNCHYLRLLVGKGVWLKREAVGQDGHLEKEWSHQ